MLAQLAFQHGVGRPVEVCPLGHSTHNPLTAAERAGGLFLGQPKEQVDTIEQLYTPPRPIASHPTRSRAVPCRPIKLRTLRPHPPPPEHPPHGLCVCVRARGGV